MTVIGDLVKDNPFYTDYYKKEIPQGRFVEQITPQELNKALIQQSCVEVAKKITLVALVFIPSIYVLGVATLGSTALAGALCAIGSVELEGIDLNILKVIELKGNLLAALPAGKRIKNIFLYQLGMDTVLKSTFASVVLFAPAKISTISAHLGAFFVVYSLTKEIEKLLLLCVKIYALNQAQKAYDNLQSANATT